MLRRKIAPRWAGGRCRCRSKVNLMRSRHLQHQGTCNRAICRSVRAKLSNVSVTYSPRWEKVAPTRIEDGTWAWLLTSLRCVDYVRNGSEAALQGDESAQPHQARRPWAATAKVLLSRNYFFAAFLAGVLFAAFLTGAAFLAGAAFAGALAINRLSAVTPFFFKAALNQRGRLPRPDHV